MKTLYAQSVSLKSLDYQGIQVHRLRKRELKIIYSLPQSSDLNEGNRGMPVLDDLDIARQWLSYTSTIVHYRVHGVSFQ